MNKTKTSLLLLSSLLLLASCGTEQTSSSSEGGQLPSSSETLPTPEPDSSPSEPSSSEPELTAEERFRSSFDAYVKNTLEGELSATSAVYVEEGKTYEASFFQGQAVQNNPGDVTLVRSIEGNSYLEYRFSNGAFVDFQKEEILAASRKEAQKKISTLFVGNGYGMESILESLKPFAKGGEGLSYDYQSGVYTLVSKGAVEGGFQEDRHVVTIREEAIAKWSLSSSLFAQEGDASAISTTESSFEWKKEGEKIVNPNAYLEANYAFTDLEAKLLTEDGHYYVGNTYSAVFSSPSNPHASALVDPVDSLLPEDNGILSYDSRNKTFKVLKAGEVDIPFLTSRGVSKTLRVTTEDKPILGIRADREDGELEAGSTVELSATVLPATAQNQGKYVAEITLGGNEADLTKNPNGGYLLSIHQDATVGAQIEVTFTSTGLKEDGSKATAVNLFTVKEAPTGGLEGILSGTTWTDEGYPASTVTFHADKTGEIHYNSLIGETIFQFTWNNATESSLADEGSFVELDYDGFPMESTYTLLSFRYENSTIVLKLEFEDPVTFVPEVA